MTRESRPVLDKVKNLSYSVMRVCLIFLAVRYVKTHYLGGESRGGGPELYTVMKVSDGDTITVTQVGTTGPKIKVRLACIDAPEMAQGPAGEAGRDALAELAPFGGSVSLRVIDTDRYKRSVAEVFVPGGGGDGEGSDGNDEAGNGSRSLNVNLELVRQGKAFVYRDYLKKGCAVKDYEAAEAEARERKRGVWAESIEKPWDYRKRKRQRKGKEL